MRDLTNWTHNQNRDRLTDRARVDSSGGWGCGSDRIRAKQKGLVEMDNSVMIAGGAGGGSGYKGIKGNGKSTIKIN